MKKILTLCLSIMLLLTHAPFGVTAESVGSAQGKPLEGKTISIMGDSISTYTGYSDANPITSEGTTNRYGEPYYCPVGYESQPGCHNTELLVSDTWWHQAATELGAEVLVSNAGNSTGLLYASYPSNLEWDQYLKDMLAYKTRPYHMGTSEADPDIIALYIGSADAGKLIVNDFGTLSDINFSTLIVDNGDGTYTYATPTKVIEAYAILLHKLTVTYPNAEIYCLTVVPNSGGDLTTANKRVKAFNAFNEMIKSIANHYGAIVVDIFDEFALDKDGNGETTQALLDEFKTNFYGDPHPNAKGFDVITKRFVETVLENSKYIVEVESTAGNYEQVGVDVTKTGNVVKKGAVDFITESGMFVDYESEFEMISEIAKHFEEHYTSESADGLYKAQGGKTIETEVKTPATIIGIPLEVGKDSTRTTGGVAGTITTTGDIKETLEDGEYNYIENEVLQQGSVTITTEELDVVEEDLGLLNGGMTFTNSTVTPSSAIHFQNKKVLEVPTNKDEVPAIKDGYEFVYIGSDKFSQFYACYGYNDESLGLEGQGPLYQDDEYAFYVDVAHSVFINRNLAVKKLYLPTKTVVAEEGELFPGRYESIQQFTMSDKNAQIFTTYCADQNTPALKGYSYNIMNLIDSTNYGYDEARMLQTVANNGYWGTSEGFGSLARLEQKLKEDEILTDEEIAIFDDGMATTATQYAIWTFSNKMDKRTFYNAYFNEKGIQGKEVPAEDLYVDIIFKVYHYLTSLEPSDFGVRSTRNIIINEKNFINSTLIEVKSKPLTHANNLDSNKDNDAYLVDIHFDLKVTPDQEVDDLVLNIMEGEQVVATGRIAGTLLEGEVMLEVDENGYYTFADVTLSEGQRDLRFVLHGEQHLEKTPYLLVSEVRDGVGSQNFICVAEGDRNVNISLDLIFDLDIEDEVIERRNIWRNETIIKVGKIEGLKIDNKDKPIKNVKFGLFYEGEEDFSKQNAIMIAKTDKEGIFVFEDIPYGNYLIKELSCPGQYIMSEEIFSVTVGDETPVVNMTVVNFRRPPHVPNTSHK